MNPVGGDQETQTHRERQAGEGGTADSRPLTVAANDAISVVGPALQAQRSEQGRRLPSSASRGCDKKRMRRLVSELWLLVWFYSLCLYLLSDQEPSINLVLVTSATLGP